MEIPGAVLVSPGHWLDVIDGGERALGLRHQQLGVADGGGC